MSNPHITRCVAVLAFFAATAAGNARAQSIPNPEFDLEPELAAKLLKEKARQKAADGSRNGAADGFDTSFSNESNPCGNVVINSNNPPTSNSGIRDMFGKESVTIITGPVINAANCK
jgi:hypothetical protein